MLVFSLVNYILPNVVWKKIYLWFFYGINELKSFFTTDMLFITLKRVSLVWYCPLKLKEVEFVLCAINFKCITVFIIHFAKVLQ